LKEKSACCGSQVEKPQNSCCSGAKKEIIPETCCTAVKKEKTPDTCCSAVKKEINSAPCCSGKKEKRGEFSWIAGYVNISEKKIPLIKTELSTRDYPGMVKMRFHIGRKSYTVPPGLYGTGNPDKTSPVVVTANYKMTFDFLRKELKDRSFWILVLNTYGINVWCAAGKGTFGTEELLKRIDATGLSDVVSHREIIVPQLGAPGICAHKVKKRSGFRVLYGPVRAKDLPGFVDRGKKATSEMRKVYFTFSDRLCLTPVELIGSRKITFLAFIILFLLGGVGKGLFNLDNAIFDGGRAILFYITALFLGAFITPLFLPWIPGRAFALKGCITGIIFTLLFFSLIYGIKSPWYSDLYFISWLILIPSASSFFAMNFTGATTFTSLSGVIKEMRYALPVQIILIIAGLILWKISQFL